MKKGLWSLLALITLSGCINFDGSFEAMISEEGELTSGGEQTKLTERKEREGKMVLRSEQQDKDVTIHWGDCPLKFTHVGTAELDLNPDQSCKSMRWQSYEGPVTFTSGNGGVNRNSSILSLELVGKPAKDGATGEIKWVVTGLRK